MGGKKKKNLRLVSGPLINTRKRVGGKTGNRKGKSRGKARGGGRGGGGPNPAGKWTEKERKKRRRVG